MPATTPGGLPYPLPADPVSAGADDIKALALAVDPKLPVELAYTQITAAVGVTATTEAGATDLIAGPSVTYPAVPVPIIIELFCPIVISGDANIYFSLWDGATNLGMISAVQAGVGNAGSTGVPVVGKRRLTPAAGPHAYKIKVWKSAAGYGTTVYAGAGGVGLYLPGYLRVCRASV